MSYRDQKAWKEIQGFLPEEWRLTEETLPVEEYWDWEGHKVHLDAYRNAQAPAKVILFHGVGTNGRQMTTILGRPLAEAGYEAIAIDMPTYGETVCAQGKVVSYHDWVRCGADYVDAELARDDRPVFLYGLSAGGMEVYHVAARNKKVAGIIGMTFLDQRIPQVQRETVLNPVAGAVGTPMMRLACRLGQGGRKMKMSEASKMWALVNDEAALAAMMADTTSAGNSATFTFLTTYADYVPEVEPEDFDVCPVMLAQPEDDRWTPQYLAELTLRKIGRVPVRREVLRHGSHYPIERSALEDLRRYVLEFLADNLR